MLFVCATRYVLQDKFSLTRVDTCCNVINFALSVTGL
jgi:hypothetical protein